jgi:hypothetical protein
MYPSVVSVLIDKRCTAANHPQRSKTKQVCGDRITRTRSCRPFRRCGCGANRRTSPPFDDCLQILQGPHSSLLSGHLGEATGCINLGAHRSGRKLIITHGLGSGVTKRSWGRLAPVAEDGVCVGCHDEKSVSSCRANRAKVLVDHGFDSVQYTAGLVNRRNSAAARSNYNRAFLK